MTQPQDPNRTADIQVGDFDGDLRENLVLLRRAPAGVWIKHFDFADCDKEGNEDYCAGFDPENPDIRLAWKKINFSSGVTYDGYHGTHRLALPNVDSDSLIVEKSDHTVYTSENTIIALLAAPPCSEEIGHDIPQKPNILQ